MAIAGKAEDAAVQGIGGRLRAGDQLKPFHSCHPSDNVRTGVSSYLYRMIRLSMCDRLA